ncbi:MAG: hypothetical protein D4R67_10760 [Bacteroidetes bacterium]|nr:MAG: hypothetical protein D4R67_10760 [Bacteroidota bacterium]
MKKFLLPLLIIFACLALITCKKNPSPEPPDQTKIVAWAVGSIDTNGVGVILYTDDAGETWKRQGDSTMFLGVNINDVWAIDQQNAWIVCSGNRIYRTINGGTTWIPVPAPSIPGNPDLYSISILNNTTLWISGDKGSVFSSIDAGNNWTVYDTTIFRHGLMQGICAITDNIIYVAGQFPLEIGAWGFIAKTLNGGITWDSVALQGNYNRYYWIGVAATDSNNVIVYGQTGHYSVTHNGGNTWTNGAQVSPSDINGLVMLSPEAYWGACDYDMIFKTFDGGETWIEQMSAGPGNIFLVGIDTYYTQTALIVGKSADFQIKGKILQTIDGGNHWYLRHVSPSNLAKVSFAHNQ